MSFIKEFLKSAIEKISSMFKRADESEEAMVRAEEYWDSFEPREKFYEYDSAIQDVGKSYLTDYGKAKKMVDNIMRTPYEELDSFEKEIYESISPKKY